MSYLSICIALFFVQYLNLPYECILIFGFIAGFYFKTSFVPALTAQLICLISLVLLNGLSVPALHSFGKVFGLSASFMGILVFFISSLSFALPAQCGVYLYQIKEKKQAV